MICPFLSFSPSSSHEVIMNRPLSLSLVQNPIPSFHLPVNLSEWFQQQRMKTKRKEIKELILQIQTQQELNRDGSDQVRAPPVSFEEPEIKETSGSTGRPPNLPIGP